jgi:anti-anti-sigma regulatory factor
VALGKLGGVKDSKMILRIKRIVDGRHIVLRLIGHLCSEHLAELRSLIEDGGPAVALDLEELTLVDVDAVNFLRKCQAEGVELRNRSLYIGEWMDREQDREA